MIECKIFYNNSSAIILYNEGMLIKIMSQEKAFSKEILLSENHSIDVEHPNWKHKVIRDDQTLREENPEYYL